MRFSPALSAKGVLEQLGLHRKTPKQIKSWFFFNVGGRGCAHSLVCVLRSEDNLLTSFFLSTWPWDRTKAISSVSRHGYLQSHLASPRLSVKCQPCLHRPFTWLCYSPLTHGHIAWVSCGSLDTAVGGKVQDRNSRKSKLQSERC